MTRRVAVLAYHFAVAVISSLSFVATLLAFAAHRISSLDATFLLIGSSLAGLVAVFRVRGHEESWPIRIFSPAEVPAQETVRPSLADWVRLSDWTRRAQRL